MKTKLKKLVVVVALVTGCVIPAYLMAQGGNEVIDIFYKPESTDSSVSINYQNMTMKYSGYIASHVIRIEIQPSHKISSHEAIGDWGTFIAKVNKGEDAKVVIIVDEIFRGTGKTERVFERSFDLGEFQKTFSEKVGTFGFGDTYTFDISVTPIKLELKYPHEKAVGKREGYTIKLKVSSMNKEVEKVGDWSDVFPFDDL